MSASRGQLAAEQPLKPPHSNQVVPLPSFSESSSQGRLQDVSLNIDITASDDRRASLETMPYTSPSRLPESSSFASMRPDQMLTPQSPSNLAHHAPGMPYTPEPPMLRSPPLETPHISLTHASFGQPMDVHRPGLEMAGVDFQSSSVMAESSPFLRIAHHNSPLHRFEPVTPKATNSTTRSESTIARLAPAHRITSAVSSSSSLHSRLSSPFMAKLSIAERNSRAVIPIHSAQSHTPEIQAHDAVSLALVSSSGSPASPTPPPITQVSSGLAPTAGGEMERIHRAMIQDRLAHYQETESRRPDYLRRMKRTLVNADTAALLEDEGAQELAAIGIMESPVKGRRLKLFQETSEESFEESLMAGGYGRYRTAEWVRQPQPLTLVAPGPAGPSNIVSALEEADGAPPTEKELKKRKRLAAFRREHLPFDSSAAKLYAVELEGRGRVLLDIRAEEHIPIAPELIPAKKKAATRRRRKGAELSPKEKKVIANTAAGELLMDRPNWPDAEFPWRLRTEERADLVKEAEAEKMRWIERFLDRDSDDEDDGELLSNTAVRTDHDSDVLPSAQRGVVYYEAERPVPSRAGRGKTVPLIGDLGGMHTHAKKRNTFFPSDPADARAALLSKKSVRTLSYRQQKRQKQADEGDEEVCSCHGVDDGRELVQCDGCQTWYHLQCIGIKNITELGREEDPWFCRACGSLTPELEMVPRQPTLVPTDDGPRLSHSHDPPFFQPSLQDSPVGWNLSKMPKTPIRSGRDAKHDQGLSSGSTWIDSSRHGPSTPYHPSQSVRVYTSSTPGSFDSYGQYDDSPFDPTSTPSRGIKFGAPFTTPKNVWSSRPNGMFQSPSRAGGRTSSNKVFGGPGTLSSTLDDNSGVSGDFWMSPLSQTAAYDESPIRRSKSGEGPKMRRVMDSPLASRSLASLRPHLLEQPPIMRSKDKDRQTV